MLIKIYHLYHLVELRPWPLFLGIASFNFILCIVVWFSTNNILNVVLISLIILCFVLGWFRDVTRESVLQGKHSFDVIRGLQLGMVLFIFREIIFFFSFFWTFFHRRIAPSIDLGQLWPPLRLIGIGPFEIPLLNTLILISRGVRVTWAHYFLLHGKPSDFLVFITIMLGIYFTALQSLEYRVAIFRFSDGAFGSVFFIATGFHGIHVIIGSILLIFSLLRMIIHHFVILNPIGFELSIWYWHFVDVVWLFLFSFIYWWGY